MQKKIIETYIECYQFDELNSEQQLLIQQAKEQVKNAYAAYSGFHVGAAVLLENGEIFTANNQENAAYPSGLCAERAAVFYANANRPNVAIKAIAIAAYTNNHFTQLPISPCGACRQVLLESESRFNLPITILMFGNTETIVSRSSHQLLPLCFNKKHLNTHLMPF